jgi:hypothetical protein
MRGALLLVFSLAAGCEPVQVPASVLDVNVRLAPSVVSQTTDSAVLIQVHAKNPRWRPVVVDLGDFRLTGDPETGSGQGPGYHIERVDTLSGGGGGSTWGKRLYRFGPRGSLRHTFVVPLNGKDEGGLPTPVQLPPGPYRVTGSFGTHTTPPVPLLVRP